MLSAEGTGCQCPLPACELLVLYGVMAITKPCSTLVKHANVSIFNCHVHFFASPTYKWDEQANCSVANYNRVLALVNFRYTHMVGINFCEFVK